MNRAATALHLWAYGAAGPGPDDRHATWMDDHGFLVMGPRQIVLWSKKGDKDPDLKPEYQKDTWRADLCIQDGVTIATARGDTPEDALQGLSQQWAALIEAMMLPGPLPPCVARALADLELETRATSTATVTSPPPRIYLPAQPSPETDRQLAEVRAVYAAYRKGGRIGRVDIQAAPGHHLPERAGDLHHKAALWIGILLREIDFLRSVLMLDWKPWYPEDADTSQPPWCYVAETGELRAEVTRLVNQENDSDEQRWHWQIWFIADPGQDDENAVQLREADETLSSLQESIEAAEAAYARLTGFRR